MSFDFVVVVHDRDEGEAVKELLIPFLAERGLELSQEKTLITHIDQGFDFLGWNFKKYSVQGKRKMLIKPLRSRLCPSRTRFGRPSSRMVSGLRRMTS